MVCISGSAESLFGKDPSKLPFLSPAACVVHYLLSHSFGLGCGLAVPGDRVHICDGLTYVGPACTPVTAGNGTVGGSRWNRVAERSRAVSSAHRAAAVKLTRNRRL